MENSQILVELQFLYLYMHVIHSMLRKFSQQFAGGGKTNKYEVCEGTNLEVKQASRDQVWPKDKSRGLL